jgi:tRNA U34 5-carboxymethylaminomethyl modifying enzyme MnmG/GidA
VEGLYFCRTNQRNGFETASQGLMAGINAFKVHEKTFDFKKIGVLIDDC